MIHPIVFIFLLVVYALLSFTIWWWVKWFRSETRFPAPLWRSYLAFLSFALSSLSMLILFISVLHSHLRGGFSHYDPMLMLYFRLGFFSAFAGFVLAPLGKGSLRWRALLMSLLMSLVWFAAAVGE